jgi:hypothetical protein
LTGGSTPYRSEPVSADSVPVSFVKNEDARLVDLGTLSAATSASHVDDRCRSYCRRDWFDNARPLFHHGRIFALLGYELVEGAYDGDRVREVRRVDFAPRAARR